MPTVCKITLDATEYRRELAAVVAESREAARTLAAGPTAPSADAPPVEVSAPAEPVKVTVTADTAPAEAEVKKLENKTVTIKAKLSADTSAVEQTTKQVEETGEATKKAGGFFSRLIPESLRSKASQVFGAIRQEMTKTEGGAGKFLESVLAGGGAIGIVMAGVASIVKFVTGAIAAAKDAWIAHVETLQANSKEVERVGNALKEQISREQEAVSTLRELNKQEQLSNTQKKASAKAILELQTAYRDLNIEIDSATGKIKNFDAVNIAIMRRQAQRELQNVEAQIRENSKVTAKTQEGLRRRGGGGEYWEQIKQTFGLGSAEEDSTAYQEASQRNMELRKQRAELRRKQRDAENQYRMQRQAENADMAAEVKKRTDAFAQRRSDDAFNTETDFNRRLANRESLRVAELKKRQEIAAALSGAQRDYDAARFSGNRDGMLSAETRLLQEKQRLLAADERIHAINQQIDSLYRQQDESYNRLFDAAQNEIDYNALILAGEQEKAAALKLEQELKAQNLKISKEEMQILLEQRRKLGSQNLQRNLQDQAYSLFGQAMSRAGRGREFEEQKALRDAERTKGSALSSEERELVSRLAAASFSLSTARDMQLGDTSIRTNSLTARGGFAGGAKLPETDKINREIATTGKQQLEQMKTITQICEKLGSF